ncbi:MAG: heme lyase CcmF/NrfE family subunit [Pseudomonadota bacterium]
MPSIGNILLHLALVVSVYSAVLSFVGGKRSIPWLIRSARQALWGSAALVVFATSLLVVCFLRNRFDVQAVAEYSDTTMSTSFKVAALWGGMNGSLLFWVMVLMVYASLVVYQHRNRGSSIQPYVVTTLMTIATFFLLLLVFTSNPFKTFPYDVTEGRGLNPLLQNYWMLIHPPALYLGYVGMSVPFAFAIAALIGKRLDNQWILDIRKWTLAAWFFLSLGNLLGALWAYEVLGWGGYWGWDPVENASFLPWLTATALLHSVIVQEKRQMLKVWNMVLVILSFLLTITGTYLTRSGVVSSVHSFGQSSIGNYFLIFIFLSLGLSVVLLVVRRKELRGDGELDSFFSREAVVLLNNLVFVGATAAVLWGTLLPLITQWTRGEKIAVGPEYFNRIMTPIGLLLLLLTAVGPMIGWRKNTVGKLGRALRWPFAAGLATAVAVLIFVTQSPYVVLSFSLCTVGIAMIGLEYWDGIRFRMRTAQEKPWTALAALFATTPRRYGGYIVHFGVILLFIGFTGNFFQKETELSLKPREITTFGSYQIRFDGLRSTEDRQKESVIATLAVWRNNRPYAFLRPSRSFYKNKMEGAEPQQSTLVAIKRSLSEDLYVAFMGYDNDEQKLLVKAFINPLVQFVWIGGLILVLGPVLLMWPQKNGGQESGRA